MINKDYYPTPNNLIEKMLDGFKVVEYTAVLDLGTGDGRILDKIYETVDNSDTYYRGKELSYSCVEIEPSFYPILREKGYKLIANDILTFDTHTPYDLIIGNLPFSIGEECLEVVINLIKQNGGNASVLVNAETIRNQFSTRRQNILKNLENLGAEIVFLVDEFVEAERVTNVEVALIKIKHEKRTSSFLLHNLEKAKNNFQDFVAQDISVTGFFNEIIARFNYEVKAGMTLLEEYYSLKPYIQSSVDSELSSELIKLSVSGNSSRTLAADKRNYLRDLREKYWKVLLCNPQFSQAFTSNILNDLERKLKDLREYDFTLFNIKQLEEELNARLVFGVEESILKMFEDFSYKYAWSRNNEFEKNLHYYNGWATNKAHKINQKIVLPMNGIEASWSGGWKWTYYITNKLKDIVKVINYLTDDKIDVQALLNELHRAEQGADFKLDLGHFEVKFYKKRTAHIRFKNKELLDKLNIFGSQRKGWLPPSYAKKSYDEMTEKEKQIIDDFQGEEEYKKVFNSPEKYLFNPSSQLLLGN